MKYFLKITFLFLIVISVSCSPARIYTTGSYGSLKSYSEKQHYIGRKTTETYVSGDLSIGKHPQEAATFNDKKTVTAINVHRNTTGRRYNFYYGLGVAFGTYKFTEGYQDLIRNGEKSKFFAVNLKSGINYTYTRPKVDWRFVGFEVAYLNESGAYQDKLNKLSLVEDEDLYVANQKSMFTYQFYSEYVFKISDEEAFTIGFYVGDLINRKLANIYDVDTSFNGFTIGLRLKKYTISSIFETGQGDIQSTKIGLTYKL
ncbi:hypothetical protein [Thalassobellus sediminis]|uniref:hypothetical protein n=1 Tax=Thalassobellus sediminis TaxID=3367753 RepID=UPI00379FD118